MIYFSPAGLLFIRANRQAQPMLLRWGCHTKRKKNTNSGEIKKGYGV